LTKIAAFVLCGAGAGSTLFCNRWD